MVYIILKYYNIIISYACQHLFEENEVINKDENKNEVIDILNKVKERKLIDSNNLEDISYLYRRILNRKLYYLCEICKSKYKNDRIISEYVKDVKIESNVKNIDIEKIKREIVELEDKMRKYN